MAKTASKTSAPPPVIVLAGEELYLRNQMLGDIRREVFGEEDPGSGLVRLDGGALGGDAMATILDEARTASMFAPQKLVIVDPADPLFKKAEAGTVDDDDRLSNREILENYLESPPSGSTLVFVVTNWLKTTRVHKILDKQGAIRRCDPIKDYQVLP